MDVRQRRRAVFWCGLLVVVAAALAACAAEDAPTRPSGSETPATSTPATPTTAPFVTTGDRTPLDCPVIAADEKAAAENTFLVDEDCAARRLATEACALTVTDPVPLPAEETTGATRAFGYATSQGDRVVLALLPGLDPANDHEPEYVLACGERRNAAVLTRGDADSLLRWPDTGGENRALTEVRRLGADPAAEIAPGCPGTPASVAAEDAGRCVLDAWVEGRLWDVGFYAATGVRERFDGDPPTGVVWDGCREATLGRTAESCYGQFSENGSLAELSIAHDEFSGLRWVTAADFVHPDEG
ncbi:hypothetical protein IGS67_01215 [Flavimobilis sp. GY10621]|uniref:Septum formation-related domain-containing protein n=1 Tax=Flavimobilis rhizosphaerae TaxID=2775421 RepID=A0ABR9DLW1_9MICO|nr:hypothetical protein [Flavimobilis rhizosphaerae]MBD9698118.1 hypothetical protein [Flavimobilis rhizosphaerae]